MTASAKWVYIVDPPRSGVENMRIDQLLLECAEDSRDPLTAIRFYRWEKPTVSLGRNQARDAINHLYCCSNDIPVVWRPTGGRSVFHRDELTYSIVSNDSHWFPLGRVQETYRVIAEAIRAGLEALGIRSELAPRMPRLTIAGDRQQVRKNPCFASPSRYEILCRGRKLVGSAQRCRKRSFLQHGSIPIAVNYTQMAAALGGEERHLRESIISVSEAKGSRTTFSPLCEALRQGFELTFGIKMGDPADGADQLEISGMRLLQ